MLNDKVIDAAQTIMKKQFNDSPKINGFQSAIFKQKTKHFKKIDKEMVQILHRGSADSGHWFTISTLNCNVGTINVFDSVFNDMDKESKSQIASILKFDGKCKRYQCSTKLVALTAAYLPLPLPWPYALVSIRQN